MIKKNREGTALVVLRKTRETLNRPGRWTQHFAARDAQGNPVAYHDEKAECFCLTGAVRRTAEDHLPGVDRDLATETAFSLLRWCLPAPPSETPQWALIQWALIQYNDDDARRQRDIVGLIDQAIEAALLEEPAP